MVAGGARRAHQASRSAASAVIATQMRSRRGRGGGARVEVGELAAGPADGVVLLREPGDPHPVGIGGAQLCAGVRHQRLATGDHVQPGT